MRAGPLRDRVRILAPADTRDAGGAVSTGTTQVAEVAAAVEPLSSRERLIGAQSASRVALRVRMRYYAGLTPAYKLQHIDTDATGGVRTYEILGVWNPDGRRIEHICDCVEVQT